MTSKKDVYSWIADYACKHRLEDIITDVFKDVDGDILSYHDISHINLKNALVWMAVKNDCQEGLEEAVAAVDSLLDEAIVTNSLEMLVRLSLGLRLKDLYHSLSVPSDKFEGKVDRHFPGSEFQLGKKYLSQVFAVSELHDFEDSITDICKYFRTLVRNEEDKMNLSAIYPQSHFGIKLSESLKSLTRRLFDELSLNQPLNKLEQIVKFGVEKFEMGESSPWHEWLVDRLSGVQTLDDDMVRSLMTSLQWHDAVGPANNGLLAARTAGIKRKLRSSADITKPISVRQVKTKLESSTDITRPISVRQVKTKIESSTDITRPISVRQVKTKIESSAEIPRPISVRQVKTKIESSTDITRPISVRQVKTKIESSTDITRPISVRQVKTKIESSAEIPRPISVRQVKTKLESSAEIPRPISVRQVKRKRRSSADITKPISVRQVKRQCRSSVDITKPISVRQVKRKRRPSAGITRPIRVRRVKRKHRSSAGITRPIRVRRVRRKLKSSAGITRPISVRRVKRKLDSSADNTRPIHVRQVKRKLDSSADIARPIRVRRKLDSSADITKPISVRKVNEVTLINRKDHSDSLLYKSDDSCSLDLDDSFVPSSQGEKEIWTPEKLCHDKNSKFSANYNLPNLQQFLKHSGIRGCVIKLSRI